MAKRAPTPPNDAAAAAQRAAPPPSAPVTATPAQASFTEETRLLAQLASDIPHMQAELGQREQQRDTVEQTEATRAQTPLALVLQVISCEFATVSWPAEKTIPEYQFQTHPCIYGKKRPDQECRTCVHMQMFPYGAQLGAHEKRYERYGMVIPVADEQQADALAAMLKALGMSPLRRIDHEIAALRLAIQIAQNRHQEIQQQQVLRSQGVK